MRADRTSGGLWLRFHFGQVRRRGQAGKAADTDDIVLPFRDADGAAGFEQADVPLHRELFDKFEAEAQRLLKLGLVYPGYDCVIKCSHYFNLLEARGSISVSERQDYIARVRRLARLAASTYLKKVEPKE